MRAPIYECARAVHVSGFFPHALVTVYAHEFEPVGHKRPWVGFDDIPLNRALVPGDHITATQEVYIAGLYNGTSVQSYPTVPVDHQPATLAKPTVGPHAYACGQVVPVGGVTPSTRVEVYSAAKKPVPIDAAHLIGTADNTGAWVGVVTQPLKKGWYVAARQVSCPDTAHEVVSPPSDALRVAARTQAGEIADSSTGRSRVMSSR